MNAVVAALDIGGTKTAAALVTPDGTIAAEATAPTPAGDGPQAVLDQAASLVTGLATQASAPLRALGVGSAGVIDPTSGTVLSATDAIPGWRGTAVSEGLAARTGIARVSVVNDVHAHALGESWHGVAAVARSVFFVAVGTGIGASFVPDGVPWVGQNALAGHFGHVVVPEADGHACTCGGSGHLEAITAGPAIAAQYARLAGLARPANLAQTAPPPSLPEVLTLAGCGDADALAALRTAGAALGHALGGAVNLLDPAIVVVGGGVLHAGDAWWDHVIAAARSDILAPAQATPLVRTTLRHGALLGAAHLAWRELT